MLFPITDLLSHEQSVAWLETHFHPEGLRCPSCGASREQARPFRTTQRGLLTYRCNLYQSAYNLYQSAYNLYQSAYNLYQSAYNLYSGTIFANSLLPPANVVLLLRGVCKGESSAALAH